MDNILEQAGLKMKVMKSAGTLAIGLLMAVSGSAQWLKIPLPGTPPTPDGTRI
jgi:hypothetical protein